MNKKIIKQGLSVVTMIPLAFPIYAFGWQAPTQGGSSYIEDRIKQQQNKNNNSIMNCNKNINNQHDVVVSSIINSSNTINNKNDFFMMLI